MEKRSNGDPAFIGEVFTGASQDPSRIWLTDSATGTTFALTKNRLDTGFDTAEQVAGIVTNAVAHRWLAARATICRGLALG